MKVCPECQTEYQDDAEFCDVDGMKLRSIRKEEDDPMIGRILEGRWVIEEKIGEGGMGSVYAGSQRSVNRKVAIKTLRPTLVTNDEFVDRFFREAKIATTINHPNCVTILDFGQTEDDILYLAMEFLDGLPLADQLEEKALSIDEVLQITEQVATALEAAHAHNIIHRDLKPDNVFLQATAGGDIHAKLLDFGIAKDTGSETQMTRTGQIFGTPNYMSPEQCSGEELDGRSDIYALGCILYEMLCGVPPFDGANSMAILMAHVTEQVTPPSHHTALPEPVEQLTLALLQKDREHRPANASEVRQLIKHVQAQLLGASASSTGLNVPLTGAQREIFTTMDTMAGESPATPSAPHAPVNLGSMASRTPSAPMTSPLMESPAPDPFAHVEGGTSNKKIFIALGVLGAVLLLVGGVAAALATTDISSDPAASTQTTVSSSTSEEPAQEDKGPVEEEKVVEAKPDEAMNAATTPEANLPSTTPPKNVAEEDNTEEEEASAVAAKSDAKKTRKKRRKKTTTAKLPPKQIDDAKSEDKQPAKDDSSEKLPVFDNKKVEEKKDTKKKKKDKSDAIVDGLFGG